MCILLKFDSTKFGVSDLCFSKVIEEKPLGGSDRPPLVQEGLITTLVRQFVNFPLFYKSISKILNSSEIKIT